MRHHETPGATDPPPTVIPARGTPPRRPPTHGRFILNPMDEQPYPTSILDHDVLVLQQITSFMANDFEILDANGGVVGQFAGLDSGMSRFLTGPRVFALYEADGSPLLGLNDVHNWGMDTYELSDPVGNPVGTVRQKLTFFRTVVEAQSVDGTLLSFEGGFFDYDYQILDNGFEVARVTKEWAGFSRAFMGHSRYVLSIDPRVNRPSRPLILGTAVALDLLRMKGSGSSST